MIDPLGQWTEPIALGRSLRLQQGEMCSIPQNNCLEEIYSKTENTHVICWFRLGCFPLSFDPDYEIILRQSLCAGHEILTSYQMNNISSIAQFHPSAVPLLWLLFCLLSLEEKKLNECNNIPCWHELCKTNKVVWRMDGTLPHTKTATCHKTIRIISYTDCSVYRWFKCLSCLNLKDNIRRVCLKLLNWLWHVS